MGFFSSLFGGKKDPEPAAAPATPQVEDDSGATTKKEKMKRIGRAALIQTSSGGILGNATVNKQVLSAF